MALIFENAQETDVKYLKSVWNKAQEIVESLVSHGGPMRMNADGYFENVDYITIPYKDFTDFLSAMNVISRAFKFYEETNDNKGENK